MGADSSRRKRALAVRAYAAVDADVDLAFRYRHGWIKIGSEAGSSLSTKKATWSAGHEAGYTDAATGSRPSPGADASSMFTLGYQRGYAEFYDEKRAGAVAPEAPTRALARSNVVAAQKRMARTQTRVEQGDFGGGEPPLLDTVRQGHGPEKSSTAVLPLPKKKDGFLARLKADQPVIGTWLSNEVGTETDLTRHVATQSGVKRYRLPIGTPLGRHLPGSSALEAKELDIAGTTFDDHVKRLDSLMKRVENNDESATIDEEAWKEVAVRLEAMSKIAKTKETHLKIEKKQSLKAAAAKGAGAAAVTFALKEHLPQKVVKFGKEWANEGAAHSLAVMGTNFSVSAASLIGAQQSEHFVEAFHKIIENPAVEIGVTSAVALLISALITRIRKALRERRDRRVAKARGERLTGETPVKRGIAS